MIKSIFYIKFLYYLVKFYLRKKINNFKNGKPQLNLTDHEIIREIKNNGYSLNYNFFSKNECQEIIKIIEKFIENNKEYLQCDDHSSDVRVFGINNANIDLIQKFYDEKFLKHIGENFLKCRIKNFFTMFGKTTFKLNNTGSGGGWHRDNIQPTYKAMIYLTDVNKENGAFQMIKKSNKLKNLVRDYVYLNKKNILNTRFSNHEINNLIEHFDYTVQTLSANAGTVILFDGSCLHRGLPLVKGARYALTNYYYPTSKKINENDFKPMYKRQ